MLVQEVDYSKVDFSKPEEAAKVLAGNLRRMRYFSCTDPILTEENENDFLIEMLTGHNRSILAEVRAVTWGTKLSIFVGEDVSFGEYGGFGKGTFMLVRVYRKRQHPSDTPALTMAFRIYCELQDEIQKSSYPYLEEEEDLASTLEYDAEIAALQDALKKYRRGLDEESEFFDTEPDDLDIEASDFRRWLWNETYTKTGYEFDHSDPSWPSDEVIERFLHYQKQEKLDEVNHAKTQETD